MGLNEISSINTAWAGHKHPLLFALHDGSQVVPERRIEYVGAVFGEAVKERALRLQPIRVEEVAVPCQIHDQPNPPVTMPHERRVRPLLFGRARLDLCQAKGFDALEPDNMEIYTNDTGFPLTYDDQLKFALWLAEEAHKRGLAIGQKNASDQVADLVNVYDFAITEDYFFYNEAETMLPYIKANKPVFAAEYTDLPGDFKAFCEKSKQLNFSAILKKRELDAWIQTCP